MPLFSLPFGDGALKGVRLATVGVVLGSAAFLAGCGGGGRAATSSPSADFSTPLAAAQSWFDSINTRNLTAAQQHFVPSERFMMDWGEGDTATWSTFTKLRCKTLNESGRRAVVYCSFTESPSSSEGNPDSFWTISLQHTTSGRWLINNYGQG